MAVFWLQQTEADVPSASDWLSAGDAARLGEIRFAKRRADWRLGRWTAKCATAIYLNLSCDPDTLAHIEIRPSLSGAPEVFRLNQQAPVAVSLSHREATALCAIAPLGTDLGCDLEVIEPHSDAFIADYFTDEEQAAVARASAAERARIVTLMWSAKESALKALRVGLRVDTRCVVVSFLDRLVDDVQTVVAVQPGHRGDVSFPSPVGLGDCRPLQVRHANGQIFSGWWQQTANMLRTLVATPPPACPIRLDPPNRCQFEDRHDKMMRTHLLRSHPISLS